MESLATPYLQINRALLSVVGQWPHQSPLQKYVFYSIMLFFGITQTYLQTGGMIGAFIAGDMNLAVESIPTVLVDLICFAKIINFSYHSEEVKKLLLILENDYKRFKLCPEIDILNRYASFGKKLTLLYAGTMYGTICPFILIPAVPIIYNCFAPENGSLPKQLMFAQVQYLMDTEKYYYPILLHGYFGSISFLTVVIAIDSIFMVFVQHACAAFSIVGYSLQCVANNIDLEFDLYPPRMRDHGHIAMMKCIVKHNHALKYAKLIEDVNCVSYFFQLGISMICISFTGFQIVLKIDEAPDIAIRFAAFSASQTFILFLLSWPGQMLYDHSTQISENVHKSGWYRTSMRTRKLFTVMTMRSRVASQLTAGKFYVLNLASFSAVVRASMQYVTVLLSMK